MRTGRAQLLRPYPHFTGIAAATNTGYSYYHSLQVQTERRFSRGFTFQAGWTWSKFMEGAAFLNDADLYMEKVISAQDFPHRLSVSGIWELPFGRGRPLGRTMGPWLDALAGGWQVQGAYEGQSGPAPGWGNVIFTGGIKNIPLPVGERRVERWFNVDAGFERDSRRQLASNIRTFPSRFNNVRGDGINNFDLSMFKNFRVTEWLKAQFRLESFNAMNHAQFSTPSMAPVNTAFGAVTAESGHGQRQVTLAVKLIF